MKDIIHVHTTFMCVLHMCVWIGVVLGPGTCGMERFEGPSELHMCLTDDSTVIVVYVMSTFIHVHLG